MLDPLLLILQCVTHPYKNGHLLIPLGQWTILSTSLAPSLSLCPQLLNKHRFYLSSTRKSTPATLRPGLADRGTT